MTICIEVLKELANDAGLAANHWWLIPFVGTAGAFGASFSMMASLKQRLADSNFEDLKLNRSILMVLAGLGDREGKKTLFAAVEKVRFRRQVRPGERLRLKAKLLGGRAGVYKIQGWAHVGEELACEATVTGALRD